MATKHYLFFGFFLIALCLAKGLGDRVVEQEQMLEVSGNGALEARQLAMEPVAVVPDIRQQLVRIAEAELGVSEATGLNDGPRVEEYLRYTDLGKGYAWCAAFVSWVYGQAGFSEPRNPWSPALFPDARTYWKQSTTQKLKEPSAVKAARLDADLFAIYGQAAKRINHVGMVKALAGDYLTTIEGNSNNRVESRRRHLRTIYALSDWVTYRGGDYEVIKKKK